MGYIYRVSLKSDPSKSYIGQTRNDPETRWRQHINDKIENSYFHNALRLYGKDAFEWEVLIICFDEDLDLYERQYIETYNTMRPVGYNLRTGGGNGGKAAPELCQKISAAKKGRPNGLLGTKKSEETRRKLSVASLGKPKSAEHIHNRMLIIRGRPNHKKGVPIIQLKNGIEIARFPSCAEAQRNTGINGKCINAVCRGEQWKHTAGGFVWKYV